MFIERIFREYGYLAIATIAIIIFWEPLNELLVSVLLPLVSKVARNSWNIQVGVMILPLLFYLPYWSSLTASKELITHRRLICLFFIALYLFFRFSCRYEYYGVDSFPLSYSDSFVAVCTLIEFILAVKLILRKKEKLPQVNCAQFYDERPTEEDSLNRSGFVSLLCNKIISSFNQKTVAEGAFTVLINERYGAGKTSFMRQLKKEFLEQGIKCLEIKPWSADTQNQVVNLFLSELSSQLHSFDEDNTLGKLLNEYSELVTGGAQKVVHLIHKHVSKATSQSALFERITRKLKTLEKPIVVFIDDVDRLNYEELFCVLKLVRDTADFPNMFYVVAADKEIISLTLKNAQKKIDPAEYFKKFFNFEMLFPADDNYLRTIMLNGLTRLFEQFSPFLFGYQSTLKWFAEYRYFPNVFLTRRDVIRYQNLLSFSLDVVKSNGLISDYNILDYARIVLLEFLDPDWYKLFRDYPDALLFEEQNGKYSLKKEFREVFVDKEFIHQFDDIKLHLIKTGEIDSSAVPESIEYKTLPDARENALPTNNDIVASLIWELFSDTNDGDTSHLFYKYEYFKYFAGYYRKGEFSDSDAMAIMNLSEEDYSNKVCEIVEHDCQEEFIHKLSHFIKSSDSPRIGTLSKIVYLLDAYHRQSVQENPYISIADIYSRSGIEGAIMKLYMNSPSHKHIATEEEIDAHTSFFNTDSRYSHIGLILKSLYYNESFDPIFAPKLIFEWRTQLIKRFVREQLTPHPFSFESLQAIPVLERLNEVCWEEEFAAYIENNDCAELWAFSLIKPSGESYLWNRDVYYAIAPEGFLRSWFIAPISVFLSSDIIEDLKILQIGGSTTASKIKDHPYLSAAVRWHRKQGSK
jgi:hypothetical protein